MAETSIKVVPRVIQWAETTRIAAGSGRLLPSSVHDRL